jgi:hypothetical protein
MLIVDSRGKTLEIEFFLAFFCFIFISAIRAVIQGEITA